MKILISLIFTLLYIGSLGIIGTGVYYLKKYGKDGFSEKIFGAFQILVGILIILLISKVHIIQ